MLKKETASNYMSEEGDRQQLIKAPLKLVKISVSASDFSLSLTLNYP